jgi:hypothetical protein
MHPGRGFQSNLVALTLALMLVVLWLLMHGYQGLGGDAQIYAFQAMARLHPALFSDLYLQNASQDQFTCFSPVYAAFISLLGLENAARLLTLLFTVWFFGAAWYLAAALSSRGTAWLAVAFLIIVAGDYGGSGVFHLSENYLTARLPAQAMILTAIALHLRGFKFLGQLIAVAALFIHPLMALPGLLLLICLRQPIRMALIGAAAGVIVALCIAFAATNLPGHMIAVMDTDWLDVVKERSQFLFLQLWSLRDWDVNLRPCIYLSFMALAVDDARTRNFCVACIIVGLSGLGVGLAAGIIGPVAILVQGQAWRWIWLAGIASVLLLPSTLLRVWRDEKCGPLCSVLLICGWALSSVVGSACLLIAITLWLMRSHIRQFTTPYLRWLAALGSIAALAWADSSTWSMLASKSIAAKNGHSALGQMADITGVKLAAASLFAIVWWWVRGARGRWVPSVVCAALLASLPAVLPAAFTQPRLLGAESAVREFQDWSDAIPATSTVLVAPTRDVGAFVWFTLGRPNYLALDQSAGVVFSRETALEVRRRSEVLLPITDPTWKILSAHERSAEQRSRDAPTRPLNAQSLRRVCADPLLGFVISPEKLAFRARVHHDPGLWENWNLYDCADVRSTPSL